MLKLEHVRKTFGATVAVDGVSLEVRRGEIFGLLGPNGAGKSTTVNLAVGLLRPDEGRIEFDDGGSPTDPRVRARIGVAPQSLAIYDELSGEENIRFFACLHGLNGKTLNERVRWALDFVGLADRRNGRANTYSGGMKRRLNLAAAVVHDPPLILLDEPTVGVDPQSRNAILEKILELRRQGRTIVYTTHYMEEAQRLCDRVGILDRGKLLASEAVPTLIASYGGKDVLVVENVDGEVRVETDDPVRELTQLQSNGNVLRFRMERPNLETVFLKLTGRHLRD